MVACGKWLLYLRTKEYIGKVELCHCQSVKTNCRRERFPWKQRINLIDCGFAHVEARFNAAACEGRRASASSGGAQNLPNEFGAVLRERERKREQGKVAVERSAVVNTSQVHRQAVALLIDVY